MHKNPIWTLLVVVYRMLQAKISRNIRFDGLKNFLKERGIQLSDGGKGKRKAELVDLCEKAAEMKQAKLEDTVEDYNKLLEEKLQTEDAKLSDPKTLIAWTNSFSNIPEFTFGDRYNYLVGSEESSKENLRSFKSVLGYKLYRDGHVTDLKCCPAENRKFFFFKFKVKPTKRAKTEDGQTTYNGFIILKASGKVHSAHCPCKGGSEGCCRHIAAVLFDLQVTVSNNMMSTCTSSKCEWRGKVGTVTMPLL